MVEVLLMLSDYRMSSFGLEEVISMPKTNGKFDDDGNYTIKVRSYDTSGNTTDSQPINLIITPLNIITWPHNNSVVSELVLITCMLYDKDGIEKVELFVNDVSINMNISFLCPFSLHCRLTNNYYFFTLLV